MLRFAQHDKTEDVIPSVSEESSTWMLRFAQHDKTDVIPNTLFCHSSACEESTHGCFTSLSMTRPKMSFRASARNPAHGCLRFVRHDRPMLFRTLFFVIPAHARNPVCGCFTSFSMTNWWMLRFIQHDRPKMSFRTLFFVIPNACEESSTWMLRFAQHDKTEDVIPSACEDPLRGCFASLSMTNWWMLHFIQHDRPMLFRTLFFVIPAHARNPLMDASLRSA
jgi:hypothetical protein